jgi:uncharacterized alpha-E superfamily protein
VADSVSWKARYIERCENVARFIEVNLHMSLDAPAAFADQWEPLVAITGDLKPFKERYGKADRESVIHFLTFDGMNPNSIISCLRAARRTPGRSGHHLVRDLGAGKPLLPDGERPSGGAPALSG